MLNHSLKSYFVAILLISGWYAFTMVSEQEKQAKLQVKHYLECDSTYEMYIFLTEWRSLAIDEQQMIMTKMIDCLNSPKAVPLRSAGDMYCRQWAKDGRKMPHPGYMGGGTFIEQDICREDGRAAFAVERFLSWEVGELHNGVLGDDLDKVVEGTKTLAMKFVGFSVGNEFKSLVKADSYSNLVTLTRQWQELSFPAKRALIKELLSHLSDTQHLGLDSPEDMRVKSRMEDSDRANTVLDQDVLIVGGRCAWAVEQLMERAMPSIHEGLKPPELNSAVEKALEQFEKCHAFRVDCWWPRVKGS